MTDEQKTILKRAGAGAGILLFVIILAWLSLSNAGKVNYNTRKLADVKILQGELEYHYYMRNQYPDQLEKIVVDLPLNFSIQSYSYAACDKSGENCDSPERRESYQLVYGLKSAAGIEEGRHVATPGNVMNR